MHFDHRREIQLVEKGGDMQALVMRVAFQVVHIQNQAASGAGRNGVEEAGRGELRGRIGQ